MPPIAYDFPRQTRPANPYELLSTSDGDTPVIRQPVRMVSCDTPEKAHYAGRAETAQVTLDACRERLTGGFYDALPRGLRTYLAGRLTRDAAARHIAAAEEASKAFVALQDDRLTLPDGRRRKVGVIPTGEIIDRYGRMLAYLTPWFSGGRSDPLPPKDSPQRRTFNLDMVAAGWAATFLIYPSLPRNDDLNLLVAEGREAFARKRGMWKVGGPKLLLAYEYRMCVKLGRAKTAAAGIQEAFQRTCVDLRSNRLVGPFDYHKVPPADRLWVWNEDVEEATAALGLQA